MFLLDFCAPIMKYMGDYPSKKQRLGTDLTDQVFEHGLVHVSGAWGGPWQLLTLITTHRSYLFLTWLNESDSL